MNRTEPTVMSFERADMFTTLESLSATQLDALSFGVIGFDADSVICIYNAPEARWAGLERVKVLGSPMFDVVAPCMNNYLVAERFRHAAAASEALDVTLDYVLTLRMQPTPVVLRLLATPSNLIRFILIQRK